jgi:hypothetical protein
MTPLQDIYDAFLVKMLEDEWENWTEEEAIMDWYALLLSALPRFKFPRVDLTIKEKSYFEGNLSNEEIQILATYMKCEWLNRSILTWENVKPLYEERDFSQANLLDKLNATLEAEKNNAKELESLYYRSRKGKPFDYSKLAGK